MQKRVVETVCHFTNDLTSLSRAPQNTLNLSQKKTSAINKFEFGVNLGCLEMHDHSFAFIHSFVHSFDHLEVFVSSLSLLNAREEIVLYDCRMEFAKI